MEKRDHTRIYGLLRRLGHTGTEDEIAERIMATRRGGVRTDVVAAEYGGSAPHGSAEWRENRAQVVSVIVGSIVRIGRAACVMPDAGGMPCEPDGHGVAEDPDEDATSETVAEVVAAVRNCDWQGRIDAVEDILSYMKSEVGEVVAAVKELQEDESEDVRLHAFYALCTSARTRRRSFLRLRNTCVEGTSPCATWLSRPSSTSAVTPMRRSCRISWRY